MDELAVVQSLAGGKLLPELYKALVLTAEEVIETRKAGSVTLTLKVSPAQGSDVAVVINEDLKRKPPTKDPHGAMYFAIGDGLLHKADPRQQQFELRSIEGGQSELRVSEPPQTTIKEVGN